MKAVLAAVSALSLGPAMLGPLDAESQRLALALCGGGALSMAMPGQSAPLPGTGLCCAKGCQSGKARKRIDRAQ